MWGVASIAAFGLTDLHLPTLFRESTTHYLSIELNGDFYRADSTDDTPQGPIHARSWTGTLPHQQPIDYRKLDREG
jgi:hypothetical protein